MQKAVKKLPKGGEFQFKKEEFQHGDALGRQKGTHSRKRTQRRETGTQEHTLREAILKTKGSPERTYHEKDIFSRRLLDSFGSLNTPKMPSERTPNQAQKRRKDWRLPGSSFSLILLMILASFLERATDFAAIYTTCKGSELFAETQKIP